jgi:hypothetical protein
MIGAVVDIKEDGKVQWEICKTLTSSQGFFRLNIVKKKLENLRFLLS